jgi:hypothetical protein
VDPLRQVKKNFRSVGRVPDNKIGALFIPIIVSQTAIKTLTGYSDTLFSYNHRSCW